MDMMKEINLKDVTTYLYDEDNGDYFSDEYEFVEYYKALYNAGYKDWDFEDFFNQYVPSFLVVCEERMIFIDANMIVEDACEELHEDAYDQISYENIKELQELLDAWCKKQTGTITYYPGYEECVKVEKEWFDEYI